MVISTNIESVTLTGDERVRLTIYTAGRDRELPYNERRPGILVIPGGGYSFCSNREGDPIALAFLVAGYNAFVLEYSTLSTTEKRFPAQLIEAASAMKFIRDNADKYATDAGRVFVIGFSAGGHLAAMLGTMYASKHVTDALDMPENYAKPTGMILSYPVISGGEYAHRGSFDSLLGERKDDAEMLSYLSLENRVTDATVPAFIWHTADDTCVPVENSLMFASALSVHKVPFELHIFPRGEHGASLGNELVGRKPNPLESWFSDAVTWMKTV